MSKSCNNNNKIRYDDPRKPMKQTSFTVKKPVGGGGEPSRKEIGRAHV